MHISGGVVLADVAEEWWQLAAVRAWAQLRLQGYFSPPEGTNASSCPLCDQAGAPDLRHLYLECPETQSTIRGATEGTAWESLPRPKQMHLLCTAKSKADARVAARVAHALRRRVLRRRGVGEEDSDTSEEEDF